MTWCIEGAGEPVLFCLWRPPLTVGCSMEKPQARAPESLWFPAPSNQQQRWEQPKQKSPSHLTDKQGLTLCFRNAPQLNLSGKPWWILFQAKENKTTTCGACPTCSTQVLQYLPAGVLSALSTHIHFPSAACSHLHSTVSQIARQRWGLRIVYYRTEIFVSGPMRLAFLIAPVACTFLLNTFKQNRFPYGKTLMASYSILCVKNTSQNRTIDKSYVEDTEIR